MPANLAGALAALAERNGRTVSGELRRIIEAAIVAETKRMPRRDESRAHEPGSVEADPIGAGRHDGEG